MVRPQDLQIRRIGVKQNPKGFKNATKLTKLVKFFLYLQMLLALIAMTANYIDYQQLSNYKDKIDTFIEKSALESEPNNQTQRIAILFFPVTFIVSGILILKWIYRANYNAHQLGAKEMRFTPGGSIGWYFMPILSLWKPYQAMKEIWKASHVPDDLHRAKVSLILPLWWSLFLVSNGLGATKAVDELIHLNVLSQASDILNRASEVTSILLSVFTLMLVKRIYAAQMNHFQNIHSQEE